MKNKILKKSLSMLLAVLTFMSVIAVSASAEELLPEACGGAIYTTGEIQMPDIQPVDNTGKEQGKVPSEDKALCTISERQRTNIRSLDNTVKEQGEALSLGGAVSTTGEIQMPDIQFEDNTGKAQDEALSLGGEINASEQVILPDITFAVPEGDNLQNLGGEIIVKEAAEKVICDAPNFDAAPSPGETAEEKKSDPAAAAEKVSNQDNNQLSSETSENLENTQNSNLPAADESSAAEGIISEGEISEINTVSETSGTRKDTGEAEKENSAEIVNADADNSIENATISKNDDGSEIQEAPQQSEEPAEKENAEILSENIESAAETEMIAGIDTVAKVIPHQREHDPDEEAVRGKNEKIRQVVGDTIVKIGESLIPFGNTISNIIRARSIQGKDMDKAEMVIDLAADTASGVFPIAAPLVSVAKDIALKIRRLF